MLSRAKRRANQRWDKAHKAQMRHYHRHSLCKYYIRHEATLSDTRELMTLINERIQFLKHE